MSVELHNEDLVIVKLVDGSFAIGKLQLEQDYTMGAEVIPSVVDAYVLMLRPTGNGVAVAIADFMAPFIQDGEGVVLQERDWIGSPAAMPENLVADYLRKKTGIIVPPTSIILQ